MVLDVRAEGPGDAAAIHGLVAEAFRSAPHASGTEACIVRQLRSAGALSLSLLAWSEGVLVGHLAISPVTISDGASGWFGLGPVAVLPPFQGRGVGRRLIGQALGMLRGQGAAGCVVLGEPAYYGRFGFQPDPQLVLQGVPGPYFQALRWSDQQARGGVRYHPAFSTTAAPDL